MNKKLKIKIIIILLILIIIIKIIQINFIENIKRNIEEFQKLDNSYYKASSLVEKQKIETIRIRKNKLVKEIDEFIKTNNFTIKYTNFETNEIIIFDKLNNTYNINKNIDNYEINIKNSPKILKISSEMKEEISNGNIFSIFNCFRILYISTEKYNDIECYKIKTTREILYVDKDTLYPVFLEYNQTNSRYDQEKITIEYIFEVNTVTDEDIKFPDLNDYKLIQN